LVRLSDGISVGEKVNASGHVVLEGGEKGIHIVGKVSASGYIQIKGWVVIDGDVDCSGNCKIQSYGPVGSKHSVRIAGKVKPNGMLTVEGDVVV
jgi:cytoskeletal protein CcmA (bactofilin family)